MLLTQCGAVVRQGSVLSALLCNLLMADLEASQLRPLLPGQANSSGSSSFFSASAAGHLTGLTAATAEASASSGGGSPPASQPLPPAGRTPPSAAQVLFAAIFAV